MYVYGDLSGNKIYGTDISATNITATNFTLSNNLNVTSLYATSDISGNTITGTNMYVYGDLSGNKIYGTDISATNITANNIHLTQNIDMSGIININYAKIINDSSNNIAFSTPNVYNSLTTGEYNVALGALALSSVTSGSGNLGIGSGALFSNTVGFANIAIGAGAMYSTNNVSNENIAIGQGALELINGNSNIGIGSLSLHGIIDGSNNIAIGNYAGFDSSNNLINTIHIGSQTKLMNNNSGILKFTDNPHFTYPDTNTFWFGDETNDFINVWMKDLSANDITSNNLIVNNDISSNYVFISGSKSTTIPAGTNWQYINSGSSSYSSGGTVPISLEALQYITSQGYYATSDERNKDILDKINHEDGINLVQSIKPMKYFWKNKENTNTNTNTNINTGFIAQQVIKSGYGHLVGIIDNPDLKETVDASGFISPEGKQFIMNYEQVIPYHNSVLQYLLDKIESLEGEIIKLKSR